MNYKKAFGIEVNRPTAWERVRGAGAVIGGFVALCAFSYAFIVLMACM